MTARMTPADGGAALWCVHVAGPDEMIPAPDRATAARWAAQYTVWWYRLNPFPEENDPAMSWAAVRWPYDAMSHADRLAQSVSENTFPQDPLEMNWSLLEQAHDAIVDMLRDDDGQAWKEARKLTPRLNAALAARQDRPA